MLFSNTSALFVGATSYSKAFIGSTQVWPLSARYKLVPATSINSSDKYVLIAPDNKKIVGIESNQYYINVDFDNFNTYVDSLPEGAVVFTGTPQIYFEPVAGFEDSALFMQNKGVTTGAGSKVSGITSGYLCIFPTGNYSSWGYPLSYSARLATTVIYKPVVQKNGLVDEYYVLYRLIDRNTPYSQQYLTMKFLSSGYICFKKSNSSAPAKTVYYSKNGGSWTSVVSANGTQINVVSGDEIRWKGSNTVYGSSNADNHCCFSGTSTFNLYGNINSLLSGDTFTGTFDLPQYAFRKLFTRSRVVDASNLYLYFGTVRERSLNQLLSYCDYLITTPKEIHIQQLYSFGAAGMFYMCPNLTTGMDMYVNSFNSTVNMSDMYINCTSLVNAPKISISATTLPSSCMSQFFMGCTSLTKAPDLLSAKLSTNSYLSMFAGCSNLNYIKCMATDISATDCLKNWVSGVAATGTFVKKRGVSWPTGASGIPSGWTVIEED